MERGKAKGSRIMAYLRSQFEAQKGAKDKGQIKSTGRRVACDRGTH